MKRVILCSGILLAIIASSLLILWRLDNYNDTLEIMINDALNLWENEKTEETLDKVQEITQFWESYYIDMSIIVQSTTMDDISSSIAKLKPLLIHGSEEFYSECENIKFALKLIYDSEVPSFHSII